MKLTNEEYVHMERGERQHFERTNETMYARVLRVNEHLEFMMFIDPNVGKMEAITPMLTPDEAETIGKMLISMADKLRRHMS